MYIDLLCLLPTLLYFELAIVLSRSWEAASGSIRCSLDEKEKHIEGVHGKVVTNVIRDDVIRNYPSSKVYGQIFA